MLIDTMSPREITGEIFTDWSIVIKSLERLGKEYDKERRKGNVNKQSTYSKIYNIKTANQNNWLIMLSKAPAEKTYRGFNSINICSLVYYYSSLEIQVFKIMSEGGLAVYSGHFFNQYNEGLSLGLKEWFSPLLFRQ